MSPASTNRWIVSFEGEEQEEEITEKYIGRLVDSNESDSLSATSRRAGVKKPVKAAAGRSIAKHTVTGASPGSKNAVGASDGSDRPSTRGFTTRSGKVGGKVPYMGIKDGVGGIKKTKKTNGGKKGRGGNHNKKADNETVVKVKMLTGTLYLYRGDNPRAEFIRTV